MANQTTLLTTRRPDHGKGAARSLRSTGRIPAVIYGHNREAESLSIDSAALAKLIKAGGAGSAILDVTIDGGTAVKALIREIQRHPLRQTEILHVDLYEVRADEKVTLEVPVHLTGTSDGVRNFGGVLDQVLYKLQIRVFPADIPAHIDLDVTPLGIGKSIYVRDVKLDKVEVLNDPNLPVCSVVAPRTEEVVAPVAAVAATGTEPELIRKAKPDGEADTKA
ncbi:MAG: 50S ribosomal protein L25 [Gemmatimonadales bacterium]